MFKSNHFLDIVLILIVAGRLNATIAVVDKKPIEIGPEPKNGGVEGKDYFYYPNQEDPNKMDKYYINLELLQKEQQPQIHPIIPDTDKGRPVIVMPSEDVRPVSWLFPSCELEDISFYLYTSKNPKEVKLNILDLKEFESSGFIKDAPTKILTHGLGGSYKNKFPVNMKNKYLAETNTGVLNVITVNWENCVSNKLWYLRIASTYVPKAGQAVAELIRFLVEHGYSKYELIHLIGHSLGAHVSAISGRLVASKAGNNTKISRITGLDPAAPSFYENKERLDDQCADLVDVIHTSSMFGLTDPLGHMDFYPNGGEEQPGCNGSSGCYHSRSHEYFVESIQDERDNLYFASCFCGSKKGLVGGYFDSTRQFEHYRSGKCDCENSVPMGENAEKERGFGIYYLETNKASPFAKAKVSRAKEEL